LTLAIGENEERKSVGAGKKPLMRDFQDWVGAPASRRRHGAVKAGSLHRSDEYEAPRQQSVVS
jgi:hypothetical protein